MRSDYYPPEMARAHESQFVSKKHLIITTLETMPLYASMLTALRHQCFDSQLEYEIGICYCLAKELNRSYFIDAVAKKNVYATNAPIEFQKEFHDLCVEFCRESQIAKQIYTVTGTMDVSAELYFQGPRLMIEVETFPWSKLKSSFHIPSTNR